jgi:hypothetical protein
MTVAVDAKAEAPVPTPVGAIPRNYNFAADILDRNLKAGRADKPAFIDPRGTWTYRQLADRVARFAARLPEIAQREDLELLEINPLVVTAKGALVACDAKIIRDDNAGFRHDAQEFPTSRALEERSMTPLERRARDLGFQLVEMDGDVALVTLSHVNYRSAAIAVG